MRKFILFFVLSLITIIFISFLYQVFVLQKNFKNLTKNENSTQNEEQQISELPSVYLDYSQEEYNQALTNKRIIILYFTSNWCSHCIEQDKVNEEVFKSLNKDGIVALKVHILDSQTTLDLTALAQKFDVTKEETFVFLNKDESLAYKYTGKIDKETLLNEIFKLK